MSASPDNPAAFPAQFISADHNPGHRGMSLRDWFAGQFIQGAVYHPASSTLIASWAYEMADAMLAEREKYLRPPQAEAADPVDKEFAELSRELAELEAKMKAIEGEPCGLFAEHCSNPRHLEYHRLEGRGLVVRDLLARLHAQHPLSRKTS